MPASPQLGQEEIERMLVEAQAEVSTRRYIYEATRSAAMSAIVKQRDFHFCRQPLGLIDAADEELNVALMHELNRAQAALNRAREDYLQAERIVWIVRRAVNQK